MGIDSQYLTGDTLNYHLDWYFEQEVDFDDVRLAQNSQLTDILDDCSVDTIVDSADYSCTRNGNAVNNMNSISLDGGDAIVCTVDAQNAQGTSIAFDQLAASTSI